MSLREFARFLAAETGYEVSHESIRQYEDGLRVVPSVYLRALCQAAGASAQWLLIGRGPAPGGERSVAAPEAASLAGALGRLLGADPRRRGPPETRLHGWDPATRAPGRISPEALARREVAHAALVSRATAHLSWVADLLGDVAHVRYAADPDGVLLCADGDSTLSAAWSLAPGAVWSEDVAGGGDIALACAGRVPVVMAPALRTPRLLEGRVAVAAPVHVRRSLAGVLGVSLREDALAPAPTALAIVYAALATGHDLLEAGWEPPAIARVDTDP